MALVVQKYGGSSVQDADRIKKVAERIVRTHKEGNDVVVVVSAMGDTTDELLDAFKEMTLLELSEFVKQFEDTFGVTAAAPVPTPLIAGSRASVTT